MPTRSHRRSRRAPPGLRTHPTPLAGLPDPPSQADAKRPTPNPFEHAERAYAGASPRPHLVTMNCFDNSHDHRGRGCPTSTPPTNLPAQVRRAAKPQVNTAVSPQTARNFGLDHRRPSAPLGSRSIRYFRSISIRVAPTGADDLG